MTTETEKLLAKWRDEDADSWIPAGISNRTDELGQALARDREEAAEFRAQAEYDREILSSLERLLRYNKFGLTGRWDEIVTQLLDMVEHDRAAQGEVASVQRRVKLGPDKWSVWSEYHDLYDEGQPTMVGRFECEYRNLYTHPPGAGDAVIEAPQPMETAPRDCTMVRLLVRFDDHATEDTTGLAWTIGSCNDDNVPEDQRIGWQFAGWCWAHDHFTEGKGTPVGWLPMVGQAPRTGNPCEHKFRHDAGIEPYCVRCGIKEVDDLLSGDAQARVSVPKSRVEAIALAKIVLAYLGVIDAHIDAAIARCETAALREKNDGEVKP